jgi:hypothetical protein
MGQFTWSKVQKHLSGGFEDIQIAVETGTLFGNSTAEMGKHFPEVHTIELNDELHTKAVQRFENFGHIHCHHGNSGEVLGWLVGKLDKPTIFYLDAHWSGDKNTDWKNSNWKGYRAERKKIDTAFIGDAPTSEAQVPLAEELMHIMEKFTPKCVIYVDDIDKFDKEGKGTKDKAFIGEDWSHLSINMLQDIVSDRLISWKIVGKQLFVKLAEKA